MPGNASAALIAGNTAFETTTVIVRVVVPIVPVEVTMTWQLASCVADPGAVSHRPLAVSRLMKAPVVLMSGWFMSARPYEPPMAVETQSQSTTVDRFLDETLDSETLVWNGTQLFGTLVD